MTQGLGRSRNKLLILSEQLGDSRDLSPRNREGADGESVLGEPQHHLQIICLAPALARGQHGWHKEDHSQDKYLGSEPHGS